MIRFADIVTDTKAPEAKPKATSAAPADGKPAARQVPAPETTKVSKAPRKAKASS